MEGAKGNTLRGRLQDGQDQGQEQKGFEEYLSSHRSIHAIHAKQSKAKHSWQNAKEVVRSLVWRAFFATNHAFPDSLGKV